MTEWTVQQRQLCAAGANDAPAPRPRTAAAGPAQALADAVAEDFAATVEEPPDEPEDSEPPELELLELEPSEPDDEPESPEPFEAAVADPLPEPVADAPAVLDVFDPRESFR